MSGNKLKVTFVLPSLCAGGAERVVITLMNGLDREKFQPSFVNVISKGTLDKLIPDNIPVISLNQKGVMRSIPKLYKILNQIKPDIVVSTMAHMNFALMVLRRLFPETKFVIREAIVPSFIFKTHPFIAPILKYVYKILYNRADLIVSPSQSIIDEFNDIGMSKLNHFLLYNPVNTQTINNIITQNPVKPYTGLHFVASGRLHYQKGFDRLICSLENWQTDKDWRIFILGEGGDRGKLESLILNHRLVDRVFLLGHVENPWAHYACADALLLPSRWEGMPNVVLESLACGTPIIAMREAGGVNEIAQKLSTESIYLAESMVEFIGLMAGVEKKSNNISLLPRCFEKNGIEKIFGDLLLSLQNNSLPVSVDKFS